MPRLTEANPFIPGAEKSTTVYQENPKNLSAEVRSTNILDDIASRDIPIENMPEAERAIQMNKSEGILREGISAVERKKISGEGIISGAKTIAEIKPPERHDKISEGAVTYVKMQNDAEIINASDSHGNFDMLYRAIADFVKRRERGEDVYFNYAGDASGGDEIGHILPSIEALAGLQAKYPDRVSIQIGNSDRRGTSLFTKLLPEIITRFSPELNNFLEKQTGIKKAEFISSHNITEPKKAGRTDSVFFGGEFVKIAHAAGIDNLNPHQFNPEHLEDLMEGLSGVSEEHGPIKKIKAELKHMMQAVRPWDQRRAQETYPPQILEEAKKMFTYWQLIDRFLNSQSILTIYESETSRVLASHTGSIPNLQAATYNPREIDAATWDKIIYPDTGEKPGSVEKFGADRYKSFTAKYMGTRLSGLLGDEKPTIVLVGHNHSNMTERIPLDESGDRFALRVESCVSNHKKRAPEDASYVKVKLEDLAKNPAEPEKAVEFKKLV
ncbi:MAG: hypothetical protein WA057_00315 [Candidatus Magasanikiibacteriota bacterium]